MPRSTTQARLAGAEDGSIYTRHRSARDSLARASREAQGRGCFSCFSPDATGQTSTGSIPARTQTRSTSARMGSPTRATSETSATWSARSASSCTGSTGGIRRSGSGSVRRIRRWNAHQALRRSPTRGTPIWSLRPCARHVPASHRRDPVHCLQRSRRARPCAVHRE